MTTVLSNPEEAIEGTEEFQKLLACTIGQIFPGCRLPWRKVEHIWDEPCAALL
jgi:hypothetical protein